MTDLANLPTLRLCLNSTKLSLPAKKRRDLRSGEPCKPAPYSINQIILDLPRLWQGITNCDTVSLEREMDPGEVDCFPIPMKMLGKSGNDQSSLSLIRNLK
jgi:hypothetical protein